MRDLHTEKSEMTKARGKEEVELNCSNWQLLVYVDDVNTEAMNISMKKALGGQEKMICLIHKRFLLKQSVHCPVACCVAIGTRVGVASAKPILVEMESVPVMVEISC